MDFFPISGKNIASGVASRLDVSLSSPFARNMLNSAEKRLVDRIVIMIQSAESGELRVDDHYELGREESDGDTSDSDWDFEEELKEEKIKDKTNDLTPEMFDRALSFYRSGKKKRNNDGQGVQSLDTMRKNFRWIKSQAVLDSIVRYEKTGEFPKNRNEILCKLAENLKDKVDELLADGYEVHDKDIKYIALSLNDGPNGWKNFQASESWITRWKRKYRIVSRHVTVLVSQKTRKDMEKTRKLVEDLRSNVAKIIEEHPGIVVRNADQTGLAKEQHGRRTLAHKGVKRVEALVQSKSATTHSITLLPVIGSDGFQEPKLFVQLGEAGGTLPQKGCYTSPTLEIAVSSSHIMTRITADQFFRNVLFSPPVPPKLLLILDSWHAFRDHKLIRDCCPVGVELFILNIPPGATSICQPADISYNHAIKGIQRRLTAIVLIHKIDYQISQRDNLLRFSSQVHWCIGADRFKPFIAYGFYKGGFNDIHPPRFESPKDYLFGKNSDGTCKCSKRGCTRCPHCSDVFCFNCFWIDMHRC